MHNKPDEPDEPETLIELCRRLSSQPFGASAEWTGPWAHDRKNSTLVVEHTRHGISVRVK